MYYVYFILNKLNGKYYIGKSKIGKNNRLNHHKIIAKGGRSKYGNKFQYIHYALVKYGFDNFFFDIFENYESEKDAFETEKYLIELYKTNNKKYGYNLTAGGEGASGRITSDETKNKISNSKKGKFCKLTGGEAEYIRFLYSTKQFIMKDLAHMYGVGITSIGSIINNKTYK